MTILRAAAFWNSLNGTLLTLSATVASQGHLQWALGLSIAAAVCGAAGTALAEPVKTRKDEDV